jgi:hypothetical protein
VRSLFFTYLLIAISASTLNAQNVRLDSIRAVNKARTDSIKAIQAARKDSLLQVKMAREEKRKEMEALRKAKKKSAGLETFSQSNVSRADSMRIQKRDSLKQAREQAAELRKRILAEKNQIKLSNKKKIQLPLTQEMSFGYRLNSDGWSIFMTRGFIKKEERKSSFFTIDLSEKKHPKETKSLNESFSIAFPNEIKPLAYKYGKINNFYQFKLGYGGTQEMTGKLDRKSVIINWVYAGGLSLGMLKPYYLDLLVPEGNVYVRKFQKYSEENKESFLDLNNRGTILGGSSFTKGLGEISIQPGLHARSGFYFDYTATRKTFVGVEIGASAEVYFNTIDILKNTNNNNYFINIYADFRFGRRWE